MISYLSEYLGPDSFHLWECQGVRALKQALTLKTYSYFVTHLAEIKIANNFTIYKNKS